MPGPKLPSVRIEARDEHDLFDEVTAPTFPHTGPPLRTPLAQFLEMSTRDHARSTEIEVVIALRRGPLPPSEEDRVRQRLRDFFEGERQLAELEVRVNRTEGIGSFRFGLPLILVALLIAGTLYVAVPDVISARFVAFVTALLYLTFITVVWVLLWDPTEKLLFDSYFLRRRRAAFVKLQNASVRLEYLPSATSLP